MITLWFRVSIVDIVNIVSIVNIVDLWFRVSQARMRTRLELNSFAWFDSAMKPKILMKKVIKYCKRKECKKPHILKGFLKKVEFSLKFAAAPGNLGQYFQPWRIRRIRPQSEDPGNLKHIKIQ